MEKKYYVYAHLNPITSEIFYIGIGKNDRVLDGGSKRNKSWKDYVYRNKGFTFKFLHNNLTKEESLILERKYIREIGLENLTNIVGEEGNSTAFKKGQIPWNKGLTNCQNFATKKVEYDNVIYNSINDCIKSLGIGKTTFYRYVKKNKVKYVYKDYSNQ
jgi:hypothetical protein